MADKRLIDANALLNSFDVAWMVEYDETGCGVRKKAIPTKTIDEAPTIDAVPVVRCKECKFCEKFPISVYCIMWNSFTKRNGFCHMGAKMDGGAEG